jgi:hypothetical protein
MTSPIPEKIRQRVWTYYVLGYDVTIICRKTGISRSSFYNMADMLEKRDPDTALMRALAVNLRKNGHDAQDYTKFIRISNVLAQHGIDRETGERLIDGLLATCYKENVTPEEMITALKQYQKDREEFGHTWHEHAGYMRRLRRQNLDIKDECGNLSLELNEIKEAHEVVKDNWKVFSERDGIMKINVHKWSRAEHFKQKYEDLKKEVELELKGGHLDPQEIKKLNEKLVVPVTEEDIVEKIRSIKMRPSIFSTLFIKPMKSDADQTVTRELDKPFRDPTPYICYEDFS